LPSHLEKTRSDGYDTYDLSPPLKGYFVSPTAFENGYCVPVQQILAASRRMTLAELDGYARGDKPQASREYPLVPRSAAGPRQESGDCRLRAVNPDVRRGE
jgi:hypothetical protein